jgi:hypothetical protein
LLSLPHAYFYYPCFPRLSTLRQCDRSVAAGREIVPFTAPEADTKRPCHRGFCARHDARLHADELNELAPDRQPKNALHGEAPSRRAVSWFVAVRWIVGQSRLETQ